MVAHVVVTSVGAQIRYIVLAQTPDEYIVRAQTPSESNTVTHLTNIYIRNPAMTKHKNKNYVLNYLLHTIKI